MEAFGLHVHVHVYGRSFALGRRSAVAARCPCSALHCIVVHWIALQCSARESAAAVPVVYLHFEVCKARFRFVNQIAEVAVVVVRKGETSKSKRDQRAVSTKRRTVSTKRRQHQTDNERVRGPQLDPFGWVLVSCFSLVLFSFVFRFVLLFCFVLFCFVLCCVVWVPVWRALVSVEVRVWRLEVARWNWWCCGARRERRRQAYIKA